MKSDHPIARPRADLWPEPPSLQDGSVELACRLELDGRHPHRLWFRFPANEKPVLTERADPWLVAVLIYAMRHAGELRVHGTVSAGLISNLSDFQHAFCAFHDPAYRPVPIQATHLADGPTRPRESQGITAFSGGVDGAFSIFRHTSRSGLTPKRPLRAALLMQGMDIPVEEHNVFKRVLERCRIVTRDAGLVLHTGSTNLRSLGLPWDDQFGSAVAASLLCFQEEYTFALIPSSYDYNNLHLANGSNPLTDNLLSSPWLSIIHDGADFGRIEKIRQIAAWPAALDNLRVCWQPGRSDNCGRCEKCVRTQLMLELSGIEHCRSFGGPVSSETFENLVIHTSGGLNELAYLLSEARKTRPRMRWIGPLSQAIARNKRYLRLQSAVRGAGEAIPGWFRRASGSLAKRIFAQERKPKSPAEGLGPPAGKIVSKPL